MYGTERGILTDILFRFEGNHAVSIQHGQVRNAT